MKKILFSLFALCGALCINAQVVSNIRAMQQDTTLVIVYDLSAIANTKLQVSFDGGATFRDAKYVSGEIGQQQAAGTNRIAYWNAVKDAGYFDCSQMVFKVIASNIKGQKPVEYATTNEILSYRKGKVYQEYQDISKGYKYFLKNNSPEAYKVYKQKWHGMFWAGFGTFFIASPILIGSSMVVLGNAESARKKGNYYDYGYGEFGILLGFGCLSWCTGLTLMCASTSYARKHSVKAYNASYGSTPYTLAPTKKTPVELHLGATGNGLGLSLHF